MLLGNYNSQSSTQRLSPRTPRLRVSILSNHEGAHVGGHGCLQRGSTGKFGNPGIDDLADQFNIEPSTTASGTGGGLMDDLMN